MAAGNKGAIYYTLGNHGNTSVGVENVPKPVQSGFNGRGNIGREGTGNQPDARGKNNIQGGRR